MNVLITGKFSVSMEQYRRFTSLSSSENLLIIPFISDCPHDSVQICRDIGNDEITI